jgi:hypothetical protein
MRMLLACLVSVSLLACGDNGDDGGGGSGSGETCEPATGALPLSGALADPFAIDLADECVEGGLRDLPGRWFLRVPETFFQFEYPKYEGNCTDGFARANGEGDDHDESDEYKTTHYTWSDGTRYYERARAVYPFAGGDFEYVRAKVACMRADGTLAFTNMIHQTGSDDTIFHGSGERFAPKDDVASGIELVGELGNGDIEGLNLIVENNIAYVVGVTGFDTVDVTAPAAPVHLAHIDGYLNDVRIAHGNGKTVAFAASEGGDDKVWIIDVTDPAHPEFSSVIDEYAHSLQIRTTGDLTELFLANYTAGVPRYDVSDPLNPVKTGTSVMPGQTLNGIHDLTVYGDVIYANNTDAGFVAADTSASFSAPTELGRRMSAYSHASWAGQINGKEIVLHGDEGMNHALDDGAAFMRIIDGDRSSPTYLQDLAIYRTRKQVGIHNIEVHGTRAYISYYQDGVRVVDLADPTNPVEVAHYNTWDPETAYGDAFEGAVGLRKVGDYIYVADLERGLIILREL